MFANLKASLAPLILRWGLAAIFLYNGFLKISFTGAAGWTDSLPAGLQFVIAWGEVCGGAALLFGLLSRLVALWFAVTMIGAIIVVTGPQDFVHVGVYYGVSPYRWEVGYEFNFALIAMSAALIVLGSGTWSVDHLLFHSWQRRADSPAAPAAPPGTFQGASHP
jgi:putative oxidoreductase